VFKTVVLCLRDVTSRKLALDLLLVAILAVVAGDWMYPKKATAVAYSAAIEAEALCAALRFSVERRPTNNPLRRGLHACCPATLVSASHPHRSIPVSAQGKKARPRTRGLAYVESWNASFGSEG
jgi:hypothetical protein